MPQSDSFYKNNSPLCENRWCNFFHGWNAFIAPPDFSLTANLFFCNLSLFFDLS